MKKKINYQQSDFTHTQHIDDKNINKQSNVNKYFFHTNGVGGMIFLRIFAIGKNINQSIVYIMEINITEENFNQVLAENPVVMVDFGATWCGPCKALAPVVEEIAKEYEGRAAICKADVEECPSIAAQFRIRNVPTVLFFKNGEAKDKSVGLVQKSTLTDKIDALL